jgi:hypothetical protein
MKEQKLNKPVLFPENIPEELKALKQWVMYRLVKKAGKDKLEKVPYQTDGVKASTTNSKTWCSFEQAVEAFEKEGFDGIGFVFTKGDPYCGVDLDNCINVEENIIEPWSMEWIEKFESYTERSPSGTGIHTIVKGKLPSEKGKKKGDYEIYDWGRFFTFTGNIINSECSHIEERQEVVEEFYNFIADKQTNKTEIPLPEGHELSNDEIGEIFKKARSAPNSEKFTTLFDGDWESLGYPSQSEADLALCKQLAYWTNDNPVGIDQIFRKSGLYREKWDREDYRNTTIMNALALNQQHTKDDPKDDPKESSGNNNEKVKGFSLVHISDVKHQPMEYQIDKIWTVNSVGIMSSPPGNYKTWLAWEIAVCIASGTKLFGLYECRKGKILAFNAEDSPSVVTRSRIAAIARKKKLNLDKLDLQLLDIPAITLNDEGTQKQLEITIKQYKPDMIIFDPLRNVHSLDEDSATEMTKLLHFLREINRKYSCSILLVCHDKKHGTGNGNDRAMKVRGSSALIGWRDVAIFLNKGKEKTTEVQIYNRSCQSVPPFQFTLKTENDSQGSPVTAQLVVTTQEQNKEQKELNELQKIKKFIREHGPLSKTEIAKTLGGNKQKCLGRIKTLLESDDEVVSQGGLVMVIVAD